MHGFIGEKHHGVGRHPATRGREATSRPKLDHPECAGHVAKLTVGDKLMKGGQCGHGVDFLSNKRNLHELAKKGAAIAAGGACPGGAAYRRRGNANHESRR